MAVRGGVGHARAKGRYGPAFTAADCAGACAGGRRSGCSCGAAWSVAADCGSAQCYGGRPGWFLGVFFCGALASALGLYACGLSRFDGLVLLYFVGTPST